MILGWSERLVGAYWDVQRFGYRGLYILQSWCASLFRGAAGDYCKGVCASSVQWPTHPMCNATLMPKLDRPGFIATPTRHIERLSEMDDEELFALWSVAVKAVRYLQLSGWNFCTLPVFVLIFKLQFCAEFCVISIYYLFLSSSVNS